MDVRRIFEDVRDGKILVDDVLKVFVKMLFEDIDFVKIDYYCKFRQGMFEVIFCEGKIKEQVLKIFERMIERGEINIIGIRVSREQYEYLREYLKDDVVYYEIGRIICVKRVEIIKNLKGYVVVVFVGIVDLKVVEEVVIVLEILGNNVKRMYDVGVVGIYRLFVYFDDIQLVNVVVVVVGMEGVFVLVVVGFVLKFVIVVLIFVGYGVNFKGFLVFFIMLNLCVNGVCVVNIDNGFGVVIVVYMINLFVNQNL